MTFETPVRDTVRKALLRLVRVIVKIFVNFVITAAVLIAVWILQVILQRLSFDAILFGRFQVHYLFDFIDFAVVLGFVASAAIEGLKLLRL